MATIKPVSFKETEKQLLEAIEHEDFSSYVKKLIKIDLGIIPPSALRSFHQYEQVAMPEPEHKQHERPMTGQESFIIDAEREELEL